jgi:hypothetical protein
MPSRSHTRISLLCILVFLLDWDGCAESFQSSLAQFQRTKQIQIQSRVDRRSRCVFTCLRAKEVSFISEEEETIRKERREVTGRGIALAALWLPATSRAAEPAYDTFMPPPDVKRLILCRHGQTELNRLGKIQVSSEGLAFASSFQNIPAHTQHTHTKQAQKGHML